MTQTLEIPILDSASAPIGRLAAFSNDILDSPASPVLIELIRSWRQSHREFFFTQFDETTERARDYVRMILDDPSRLMFFIYADESGPGDHGDPLDDASFPTSLPIGHLGVYHLDRPTVELDNMIRGRAGGHPHLMYWAEIALLCWIFQPHPWRPDPPIRARCRLLDDNWRTIRHHARVGFRMVATFPMTRWEAGGEVRLQPYTDGMCSGELVKPRLGQMDLTKEEFFARLAEQVGKEDPSCSK
jgi:hypothetical protein